MLRHASLSDDSTLKHALSLVLTSHDKRPHVFLPFLIITFSLEDSKLFPHTKHSRASALRAASSSASRLHSADSLAIKHIDTSNALRNPLWPRGQWVKINYYYSNAALKKFSCKLLSMRSFLDSFIKMK